MNFKYCVFQKCILSIHFSYVTPGETSTLEGLNWTLSSSQVSQTSKSTEFYRSSQQTPGNPSQLETALYTPASCCISAHIPRATAGLAVLVPPSGPPELLPADCIAITIQPEPFRLRQIENKSHISSGNASTQQAETITVAQQQSQQKQQPQLLSRGPDAGGGVRSRRCDA